MPKGVYERKTRPLQERLTENLEWNGDCLEWQGHRRTKGHGQIRVAGRGSKCESPHRVAYELWVGPIPEGMFVCHRCDNPPCCNPAHLFLGTALDNNLDMIQKGRYRGCANVYGRSS